MKSRYLQAQYAVFKNKYFEIGVVSEIESANLRNILKCTLYLKNSTLSEFSAVSFALAQPMHNSNMRAGGLIAGRHVTTYLIISGRLHCGVRSSTVRCAAWQTGEGSHEDQEH